MNKLKHLWTNLLASFWFVPSLIVAFSAVLAVVFIEADSFGNREWMAAWPRLFGAGAAGARGMLATIAGSMTTVVGVTFSMTLVALNRGSAAGNIAIMFRILGALQTIDSLTPSRSRRMVLREQVDHIAELAARTIASPHDQARFQCRLARVREALETRTTQIHEKKNASYDSPD